MRRDFDEIVHCLLRDGCGYWETECADWSREPILQEYLRCDAEVLAGCAQWMTILIKTSLGPIPRRVKAIRGYWVDIFPIPSRPVGSALMTAAMPFQQSHSVRSTLAEPAIRAPAIYAQG